MHNFWKISQSSKSKGVFYMYTTQLPEDYALVLQQVNDNGEEDFSNLAESLRFDRKRLSHIVAALQRKGLIAIRRSEQEELWIHLSRKGRRLLAFMWPESQMHPSF
jgi:DNA-binding MarR family transcriptional regulator